MRVFKHYRFLIGTKIPFSEWPGIVNAFLKQQNLSAGHFYYYFQDLDFSDQFAQILDGTKCAGCRSLRYCEECRKEAQRIVERGTACRRAEKDYPTLGPVYQRDTKTSREEYLTNLGTASGCTEEEILQMMPKLYRKYGFTESYLIYQDVNFFSRVIPSLVDETQDNPGRFSGSSITLDRATFGAHWNGIELCIDVADGDGILNADPYRAAMAQLLPGIKWMEFLTYQLSEECEAQYQALVQRAVPLVEQANAFLSEHIPAIGTHNTPNAPVSLSSPLRRLCKRYGYTYVKYDYHVFFCESKYKTATILYLRLIVDVAEMK